MDYIHLKFWPDPIAASDSWAKQGGEEAKKRACPLPHTWWSSTPTPSPTSRSSFSKSQYLSRTCSFLSSLSIFSGNPGNFEPLRDDDSEGPGVMVDGEVAFDGKDDGLILMIGHPLWPRHEGGSIPHQTRPGSSSGWGDWQVIWWWQWSLWWSPSSPTSPLSSPSP